MGISFFHGLMIGPPAFFLASSPKPANFLVYRSTRVHFHPPSPPTLRFFLREIFFSSFDPFLSEPLQGFGLLAIPTDQLPSVISPCQELPDPVLCMTFHLAQGPYHKSLLSRRSGLLFSPADCHTAAAPTLGMHSCLWRFFCHCFALSFLSQHPARSAP